MREERIETDGIPAKPYHPGDARGLLLLGHGGGGSKDDERFVGLGRQYAETTGLATQDTIFPPDGTLEFVNKYMA